MVVLAKIIHYGVFLYTLLIAVRIVATWFPRAAHHPITLFVSKVTDPYLNLFRRFIPPIGGKLDLSPLLAFFGLNILEKILLALIFH